MTVAALIAFLETIDQDAQVYIITANPYLLNLCDFHVTKDVFNFRKEERDVLALEVS